MHSRPEFIDEGFDFTNWCEDFLCGAIENMPLPVIQNERLSRTPVIVSL